MLVQRDFPGQFDLYQQVVRAAKEEGKPLVVEMDDLLFHLPENHPERPAHYYTPALLPMLQALLEADAVFVSTHSLRDALRPYNDRIFVLQNYLDDTIWSFRPPVSQESSTSTLVIGFMGTDSHRPDVEFVMPVLLRLLNHYSPRLRLRFWGIRPPTKLLNHPQVEWIPRAYRSYADFAAFFQTQSADIFIAPLVDNLFNRCKSHLKFLEYGVMGAPGVFSRLEPYTAIVQHGQNGLLANSLDEWEENLTKLIEDPALRLRLAINAQQTIREKWLLSKNAFLWREVLQAVLDGRPRDKTTISLSLTTLQSINRQLYDAYQALNAQIETQTQTIQELNQEVEMRTQTIQELNQKVEMQTQTIQELNQEVLTYVLSRSWRLTRPLRVISKKIARLSHTVCTKCG